MRKNRIGNQNKIISKEAIEHCAINNHESASGSTITLPVKENEVLFITGAYGNAITALSEGGVALNLRPIYSINFPYLRFEKDVVISGGANTSVTYFYVFLTT